MKIGCQPQPIRKLECRRQTRVRAVLPVRVSGVDIAGAAFQELAHTLEIAPTSARLGGIHYQLKPLDKLVVQYRQRKIEFEVVWAKLLKGTKEFQVGLRNMDQRVDSWALGLMKAVVLDFQSLR
jgi:hypothetical protein